MHKRLFIPKIIARVGLVSPALSTVPAVTLLAIGLAAGLVGCRHSEPNVIYMPDMVYSPAFKAQKEGSMLMPVPGTIPRDFEPFPYANDPEAAGRELKNPLTRTHAVLERGRHVFETNCAVCHGAHAEGDGSIVPRFPRPPSLHSEKVRDWSDGRIYYVISMGQNLMPSYATQVLPGDRWAAIHYIRTLQRSKKPSEKDLQIADQESK